MSQQSAPTIVWAPVPMELIRDVARRIAERFRPQRIILFGSHACGNPTRDSDVDLLVVMDTPLRNPQQASAILKAVDPSFCTDILVRTPKQLSERLAMGDVFLKEVVTKGLELYEADDKRVG